ncbi:14 kDa proline-rich protein DC2.15-like [Benincasa hispida]|uniref:14 kDa proline-rich protein DC2.15-like n=1 Tax=Benincasa hispida TaxID=102211 RepID=UPI001900646C|nr:14 kDa proline-rich protein DC2.15-like [Benincasa hispida]
MASKASVASFALLLTLNLLSLSLVSSCSDCYDPSNPTPTPSPLPSSEEGKRCPKDTLKFGICAKLLKGRTDVAIDKRPDTPCCSLMEGLIDLEAAICLCVAMKANILGKKLNIPLSLTLILSACNKKVPKGYHC